MTALPALRPIELRTERLSEPLGIDEPAPLLSWMTEAEGRHRRQTGFRVRVAAEGDPADETVPACWDSGLVESAESVDVPYRGAPLEPRTRYRWVVRLLDENGTDSGWSDPAEFETGLPAGGEWAATWIGHPDDERQAAILPLDVDAAGHDIEWIWLPAGRPGTRAYFRTTVDLPDGPVSALRWNVAGSAAVRAWLDGVPVGDGPAADFRSGPAVLAVEADAGIDGRRGLAARLDVVLTDGRIAGAGTHGGWRCFDAEQDGWRTAGFDDGAWELAESSGAHGSAPWGRAEPTHRPSPYLRKEFTLTSPVKRARLYVTALGCHAVWVNGRPAGLDVLAPGWTDYRRRVPYQTYDVTELLDEGRNALGAVLADGWYAGHIASFGPAQYGDRRWFLARLEVTHADGGTTVVGTDETWLAGHGGIRYADLQNGEVFDARREPVGWHTPGFDPAGWRRAVSGAPASGRLEAQTAPPITVRGTVAGTAQPSGPGRTLVDFGQNLVGRVRIRVSGPRGARLLVRHAEVLDGDGDLYVKALRSARCIDEYVLGGEPDGEVYVPRFTVHGFRYAEIIADGAEVVVHEVAAEVLHAAMDPIGEFACSDPRINQLQRNIVWSQRGNFLSVPTDCPQRDERLGWTGDAQVFAPTAAFNYDVRGFLRKWLRDLRDAQFPDGSVPHVAPDVYSPWAGEPSGGAAGWGDAIVLVPYSLYQAYGDRRSVEETFEGMVAWLDFCERDSDGLIRPDFGFGDWLAVTETPRDLVATAFFALCARRVAGLAEELGRPAPTERYRALFEAVRAAFRRRYVRGGGRLAVETQTAYVLAIHAGLMNPDELPKAAGRLVAEVRARNWHLSTGFLGTPYLLDALSDNGHVDAAFRLLAQDSWPSWLYPVVRGGATTMWERWDSWSESRGFQDPAMTSFNHYAYGAVGDWMYRTIAGITADRPGYRRITIRPRPGLHLSWAHGAVHTVYGRVSSTWRHHDGQFSLEVTLPPNTSGTVWLPAGDTGTVELDGRPLDMATGADRIEITGGSVVVGIGSGDYRFLVRGP